MRVFRRIMLNSELDLNLIPETRKIYYSATEKAKLHYLTPMLHKYDPNTGEGIIVMSNDLKYFEAALIKNWDSIISLTLNDGITSLGPSCFQDFTGTLILNTNGFLSTDYAYEDRPADGPLYAGWLYNSKITKVVIGENVTKIGNRTFCGDKSIKTIVIPHSISYIGVGAFSYCKSLEEVYCKPTTPPTLSPSAFDSNASDRLIYVPTESVDAYKAATNWSTYADYIVGYDFNQATE